MSLWGSHLRMRDVETGVRHWRGAIVLLFRHRCASQTFLILRREGGSPSLEGRTFSMQGFDQRQNPSIFLMSAALAPLSRRARKPSA